MFGSERLTELVALADPQKVEVVKMSAARAAAVVSKRPGLYLVDDAIEARWIIGDLVINVTFTDPPEAYVYDRSTKEISRVPPSELTPPKEQP